MADPKQCSLKALKTISDTNQKAPFYTAGAAEVSRVQADLALYRAGADSKKYRLVAERAWLGELIDWKHQIAVQKLGTTSWYLGLHHWGDSGILLWPCTRRHFPSSIDGYWFDLDLDAKDIVMDVVYDAALWVAASFEFRSPAWQFFHHRESAVSMPPAIRRVQSAPVAPLLEIAAAAGWWDLGNQFMTKMCNHLNVKMPPSPSQFQILEFATRKALTCSSEKALDCLAKRVADEESDLLFGEELLELDDVHEVLTNEDVRAVKDSQKAMATKFVESKQFREQFASAAALAAKARGKEAKEAAAGGKKIRAKKKPEWRLPLCSQVPQSEAKTYVPDGGSIWVDRGDGAWCSHYPPFKRFSRSWKKWGESEGLRLCLLDMWTKHCMVHGIPHSECPLKGLFDSSPISVLAESSGSAAAAGSAHVGDP